MGIDCRRLIKVKRFWEVAEESEGQGGVACEGVGGGGEIGKMRCRIQLVRPQIKP